LTRRGPRGGRASITIDGRVRRTVDLYSPQVSAAAISFTGLARRPHTIEVQVLGRHDRSSGGRSVAVDGFVFHADSGIAQEDSSLIQYNSWSGAVSSTRGADAVRTSAVRGARVSIGFRGSRVTWLTSVGPGFGRALVAIDDASRVVDLYRRTYHPTVAMTFTSHTKGRHTLTIRPLGRKSATSRGAGIVIAGFRLHY
jgi:hypothetical protein